MRTEELPNDIGERILVARHPSGMKVTLVPKPGFTRAYGVLAVHFGSVDDRFVDPDTGELVEVPDGVAHFLEHKMFEDEEGDVADRFSALGAHANAATGFTTTSYLFTATRCVGECVDLLLDFVQEPYFRPDLIEKEKGIIGQEIRMYDDDPSWRVFFGLLQALYREHPVRLNIAGSEASIARIDPDVLHRCHRAFYRPANMAFVLVGRFDVDDVLGRIVEDLSGRPSGTPGLHRREPKDLGPTAVAETRLRMDVGRPKLLVGWKDVEPPPDGVSLSRKEVVTSLLLEILFGASSEGYERLYGEGLIDDSFGSEFSGEFDFGFATVGGDTDDPERLAEEIDEEAQRAVERGVDAEDFERVRRKALGRFVQAFDSVEAEAHAFVAAPFRGVDPFVTETLLREVRLDEVCARAATLFDPSRRARCIVEPHPPSMS